MFTRFAILHPLALQQPLEQSYKGQHADAHWVMAYVHKTQPFMKNRSQQKCLDEAL